MKEASSFFEISSDIPQKGGVRRIEIFHRQARLIVLNGDAGLQLAAGDDDEKNVVAIKIDKNQSPPQLIHLNDYDGESANMWMDPETHTIYCTHNQNVVAELVAIYRSLPERTLASIS